MLTASHLRADNPVPSTAALAPSSTSVAPNAAPPPAPPNPATVVAGQQEVREGSTKANESLQSIVDEMKQNGMSDAQITTLLGTSDKLDSLNQQDMQKIIDLMKSVSAMPQDNDQQAALLSAFQQQKGVSTQLKSLAMELARQASTEAIIHQLEALIVRQSSNLRETQALQKAEGQNIVKYDAQKRLLTRISDEQAAIARDTTILAHTLTAAEPPPLTDPSAAAATPPAPSEAPEVASLETSSAQATNQLNVGILPAALVSQAALKDKLLQTLAVWKAQQDQETRLQQARSQVDGLIKEQQALALISSHTLRGNDPLAERQAKVNDHADLAHDIAKLNPDAGMLLAQAQASIQQSYQALQPGQNTAMARPAQTSALNTLADLSKKLADQAAAMDAKQDESPTDLVKDLQALKKDIDQAKQAAHDKPDPAQASQVAKLQQEAAPISPEAADHLNDAAKRLQQPPPNNMEAAADLAKASDAVQKQIDAVAKPAKDYEALAKVNDALKEAVEKASDANTSLKDAAHPDRKRVAADLTTVAGDLDELDSTVGMESIMAHLAIKKAQDEFAAGDAGSGKGDSPGAQQHVEAGLKILTDGQAKLAKAMKGAKAGAMAAAGMKPGGKAPGGKTPGGPPTQMADDQKQNQKTKQAHPDQQKDHPDGPIDPLHDLEAANGQVVGALSPKERDALIQYEAEKTPPEYAPMVQQYMKNISESPAP